MLFSLPTLPDILGNFEIFHELCRYSSLRERSFESAHELEYQPVISSFRHYRQSKRFAIVIEIAQRHCSYRISYGTLGHIQFYP